MEETKKGLTIKDVLIRLILIIIFIFLLIWLFPMPDIKPLNNQLFSQNVSSMKEVAKTYYTVERLPKKVNDKVRMTLQEMIDKKLAFPLMDSKGKYCDAEESYIEITKLENEYTIKVNLSCSDKEDYLIEHYGCYDICSEKCTSTTTTKKIIKTTTKQKITDKLVYEYLHKRESYKEVFDKYECNINGYTLVGDKCIKKDSKLIKVDADVKTETKTIVDKKYADVKLSYEDKEVAANQETKTETTTTYVCPSGTTEVSGTNKCSKPTTVTVNKVCPSGYTSASETTCKKDSVTTVNKVCPSGYTSASETTCSKTTITSYVDKVFYWKYVGTVTFNNKVIEDKDYDGVMYKNGRSYITYECANCYTPTIKYIYDKYVYTAKACPSGYVSVSSTKCGKETTTTVNKVCPSGYTSASATTCSKTTTTTANKVCPSGYTSASATTCSKASTITVDKDPKIITTTKIVYVCPSGSNPTSNERVCITKEAKITYTCPTGYNPTENKLICSKTSTQTITTKYCKDDSYTLSGNDCIKTVDSTDTKDADKKYKKESYTEYKWSIEKYLEGWTYTNEKRVK